MTEHAGDALSALLDGELTPAEAEQLRGHVAGCADCAGELEDARTARRLLRSLPAVEPPASFLEEMLAGDELDRIPRRGPGVLAAVTGSVAAGILLLVLASARLSPAAVEPEVRGAVERHASTVGALVAAGTMDEGTQRFTGPAAAPPTTAEPRSAHDLPAPFDAPETLAGYRLVEAYVIADGVHLLYRRGSYALSVFELTGHLDWSALPADGTRMRIGERDAWRWDEQSADGRLYVLDDDGMVIVLIGDETGEAVREVAADLPRARSSTVGSRVQRVVAEALELFSPAP